MAIDCASVPTFVDMENIKLTLNDIITFTYSTNTDFIDNNGLTRLTLNGVIQNGIAP